MLKPVLSFARDEFGATAIEYSLIAGLVSIALVTVVSTLGANLSNTFTIISDKLATIGH
jgi:pilus assembly protein Flp/PilA